MNFHLCVGQLITILQCDHVLLAGIENILSTGIFHNLIHYLILYRFTRRTHPELLEDDPNSDYLENTCLNGKTIFLLESYHLNNKTYLYSGAAL